MKENIDPRMHTAEHLLNQTMVRMFGTGRCISAHIEKKESKCDYSFSRNLTEAESAGLEQAINGLIREDLEVKEAFADKIQAQKLYDRYSLGELPINAGEKYRIIEISGYDAIPCYGPHVASTSELGIFRIVSTSWENGILRIRYKLARQE